ncbi:MAG: protein kinase [Candidatus Zixiibacteriota bacterium]|nr:MAG: protein kinase [candidate division Zixibacteria bacterium]
MSEVYLAEDQRLKRDVALKLIHYKFNSNGRAEFDIRHEAQAAASLNHPNIVTIYEIFEYSRSPVIAMEYVDGFPLSDIIKTGDLSQIRCLDISIELCGGLAEAHRRGIVHRDLKPANIMISSDGTVKIMDFGLAVFGDKVMTATSDTVSGTLCYMSPEQARGEAVDFRSDLFSLGAVLYEMVTRQLPFKGEIAAAITYLIINEDPEPIKNLRNGISDELQRIINKALEKDISARYQKVDDMLDDLKWLRNNLDKTLADAYSPVFKTRPSVAVLPFCDMSPQKDQEYFGEGIAEDIISNLTKIDGLRVVARTSSFSFRESTGDIKEIGRRLGVGSILEGSVRRIGDRIRITAQLIDVESGYHLWSERFDRVMKDMFEIQDEISLSIADRLEVKVGDSMNGLQTRRHSDNPEAYCQYLKGRFFWNMRTGDSLKKAIEFFEKALEIDNEYALAYSGLADVYRALPDYTSCAPGEAYIRARDMANRAIEIDGSLSEAHASLAVILNHMFDWKGAEREYERAIEINPGYATAYHWYALYFMYRAEFSQAIEKMKKAYSLDPLSLPINRDTGTVYYYAGEYDRAIEALQKTLELDPNFSLVHELLGRVYLKKGMHQEALEEFNKEKEFGRSWRPVLDAWIAITCMEMGMQRDAERLLEELKLKAAEAYISPYSLSWIYFALGDAENGFQWLERAYEEKDSWLCEIKVEPVFEKVRQDPRFIALLRKIGLD